LYTNNGVKKIFCCTVKVFDKNHCSLRKRKTIQLHHSRKNVSHHKERFTIAKTWWTINDGMEICEFEYQSPDWKKPRRMVAVRKNIEILTKAKGKFLLFDEPVGKYRYRLYVTNLDLPAEQIWLSYKDRADAENRIKELKYDFGLDSFCLDKFWTTEAAFRTIMIAYNLMSLFRQIVFKSKSQATLSTLRFKCFALGSWISNHAEKQP
jgi:hypothetical protein